MIEVFIRRSQAKEMQLGDLHVLAYTAELDGSSSMAITKVPPGASHRKVRSSRSDKYYYMVKGELEFVVDGETQTMMEGDACIVPVGQTFKYKNASDDESSVLVVQTPGYDPNAETYLE